MNDNELSTMVRETVADIHVATPVEAIISRGRGCAPGGGFRSRPAPSPWRPGPPCR